jgi:hypothetical protein
MKQIVALSQYNDRTPSQAHFVPGTLLRHENQLRRDRRMNMHLCSICGNVRAENQGWFLMAENRWQDGLKIMGWDKDVSTHNFVYHACGLDHVRDFLYLWVTSGELPSANQGQFYAALEGIPEGTLNERPSIGDLLIHRHGLKSTPEGLKSLLDAVSSALKDEFEPIDNRLPPKIPAQKIYFPSAAARAS